MLVSDILKSPARGDNFDLAIAESDKLLGTLLHKRDVKNMYISISTTTLRSLTLDNDPIFIALKNEIEAFNQQVEKATAANKEISNYNWKYSLYLGLRNLLKDIVSTEDKNLKHAFLARARQWFFEKMVKKGEIFDDKSANRSPADTSTRPITAATRPITAMTRAFTTRTSQIGFNRTSATLSVGGYENESMQGKSFFDNSKEEIVPSKLRAELLKDYEEGARSKHDEVEPPLERLSDYDRKTPVGILKPLSRLSVRPNTSLTANYTPIRDAKTPLERRGSQGITLLDKQGSKDEEENNSPEGSQNEEGGEGDETIKPKAGIVVPDRKPYQDDRITSSVPKMRDRFIPMEGRSNYAAFGYGNSNEEIRTEHRWRNSMNRIMMQRREQEEFRARMNQWSQARGRMEEEINRKNESMVFGSHFERRSFVVRSKSSNFGAGLPNKLSDSRNKWESIEASEAHHRESMKDEEGSEGGQEDRSNSPVRDESRITVYRETGFKKARSSEVLDLTNIQPKSAASVNPTTSLRMEMLEKQMGKLRIEQITKRHSDLIYFPRKVDPEVFEENAYAYGRPVSLSIYDQGKGNNFKPFSKVYEEAKPDSFKQIQIQAIEEVKKKLAKFKIKVPGTQLKAGILLPDLPPQSSNSKLPIPGTGLIVNPFFVERKGGGKKKKGSKKST